MMLIMMVMSHDDDVDADDGDDVDDEYHDDETFFSLKLFFLVSGLKLKHTLVGQRLALRLGID